MAGPLGAGVGVLVGGAIAAANSSACDGTDY